NEMWNDKEPTLVDRAWRYRQSLYVKRSRYNLEASASVQQGSSVLSHAQWKQRCDQLWTELERSGFNIKIARNDITQMNQAIDDITNCLRWKLWHDKGPALVERAKQYRKNLYSKRSRYISKHQRRRRSPGNSPTTKRPDSPMDY